MLSREAANTNFIILNRCSSINKKIDVPPLIKIDVPPLIKIDVPPLIKIDVPPLIKK
jgi:hypothetical protein